MADSRHTNFILDFGGRPFQDPQKPEEADLLRIDVSGIEGTHLYCSKSAEAQLGEVIDRYGIRGIHFLDSGDYHYVSKLMTDRVREPFRLVLIDHHTDMQESMEPGMLSCGDWALETVRSNKNLKECILIGPPEASMEKIPADIRGRVFEIPEEDVLAERAAERIRTIPKDLPFYLSIDKDVLEKHYAVTDWDQGELTVNQICMMIRFFLEGASLIGIDICGDLPADSAEPLSELIDAERINGISDRAIYEYTERVLQRKGRHRKADDAGEEGSGSV